MGSVLGTVDLAGLTYWCVQFSERFAGLCRPMTPAGDGGLALAVSFPVVEGVPRPGTHLPPSTRSAIAALWRSDQARRVAPVTASTPTVGPILPPAGRHPVDPAALRTRPS